MCAQLICMRRPRPFRDAGLIDVLFPEILIRMLRGSLCMCCSADTLHRAQAEYSCLL